MVPDPSVTAAETSVGRSSKITALICLDHFFSHFYYLAVLSSLPALRDALGVSYTDLGLVLAGYGLSTTLFQVPLGFVVDRYGAPLVLAAGLALSGTAVIVLGMATGVFHAAIGLLLLGLGDAVFHPANYSILAHGIPEHHAPRAYSAHNFAGQFGFAVAPFFVSVMAAQWSWRVPLVAFGIGGIAAACVLLVFREVLASRSPVSEPRSAASMLPHGSRILLTAPIIISLLVFVGIGMMNGGMRDFGITALHLMYPDDGVQVGSLVTIFLLVSLVGIALGGSLAHRSKQYVGLASGGLFAIGLLTLAIALVHPPAAVLLPLFCVLGLCSGVVTSTRDLVVRSMTPPQHAAKVFGFVSQGIGLASLFSPMLYGVILDWARPGMVFVTAAVIGLATGCLILTNRKQEAPSLSA